MSVVLPAPGMRPALPDQPDRDLIRHALDETLVVEAAAGTGKTTELVARIVELVATGRAGIDQIVAVTFTEKAAGELKLRIREELEKARTLQRANVGQDFGPVGSGEQQDERARRLQDALQRLEEAHVSTIHGFCADLLRERPVEACVDPGFEVLTEALSDRLFDQAFGDWFQRQLEGPSEGVRRALRRLPAPWSPYAADEDGPVERLRRAGRELLQWRDLRAPWRRDAFDRDAEVLACAERLCAFAELTAKPSWGGDPLFESTAHVRGMAADFRRARDGRDGSALDLDAWEARLIQLARARPFREIATRRTGRKTDYGAGVTRRAVLDAHAELEGSLAAFARRADADLAALLQQELLTCIDRYDQLKTRAGALDFLDLLLRARALIRDCAQVRHGFQGRFRYILVDEFQDTDPLQAEMLVLLAADEPRAPQGPRGSGSPAAEAAADWRRVPIRRGALFVVGDPKQSIYRFRRADVGIYQEVCDLLERQGARRVHLRTNFRSVPQIQQAVNAAFAPAMQRDAVSLQAAYVPLAPCRAAIALGPGEWQPSVVALPVPDPYAIRNVAMKEIEASLPDAVGAWIHWLLTASRWQVSERRHGTPQLVPVEARHVCILFRRFVKFTEDMTRPYLDALEARGIPHLLVGGRSFHDREEVETLRAALAAIEWPDDGLSVYAALRGPLFAIGEEPLLEYWHRHPRRRFHPFDVPAGLPDHLGPVADALAFLRALHAGRNHRPAAETIGRLLEHTRAHVMFVMRPAGERVLANVLQVIELARQYEADGGISFRGFVDALRDAAERSDAAEAPVVEEGSDGVRLMTVHKAKGLEFPVVVLADMTCKLNRSDASRYIDQARGLCAVQLVGCAPMDLLDHEAEEVARDAAEGVRLAYVAATRARDVLVVPAIGDSEYEGWLGSLNRAIYPALDRRRDAAEAPGCPAFAPDTVRRRPDDNPGMRGDTVRAGLHWMGSGPDHVSASDSAISPADLDDDRPTHGSSGGRGAVEKPTRNAAAGSPADQHVFQAPDAYPVVWWSPSALSLDAEAPVGIRREDLISRETDPSVVAEARTAYDTWALARAAALADGSAPSLEVRRISEIAHAGVWPASLGAMPGVEVIRLPRDGGRPAGRRFGTLVHGVLATAPLDAGMEPLTALARLEGRILGAPDEEIDAAAALAARVLRHPLLEAARRADADGNCRREVPLTLSLDDRRLLEGVVDLAFPHAGGWTVVDFKTDEDPDGELDAYVRQVAMYASALGRALARPVSGTILVL